MLTRIAAVVLLSLVLHPQPLPGRTAGDIILLATKPLDEIERDLRQALTHASPRVRAAAARVVAVSDDGRLTADVTRALVAEQAPDAGAELLRALVAVQGINARALSEEHAMRIGGAAVGIFLDWTARHQPRELGRVLPQAVARHAPVASLIASVSLAARDRTSTVDVLRRWMPVAPPGGWQAVLENALTSNDDLRRAEPVLVEALRSETPAIRDETIWGLLAMMTRGARLSPAVLEAARPAEGPQVDWEQVGRELIVRRASRSETPDRAAFLKSERSLLRLFDVKPRELLTTSELAAIAGRAPTQEPTGGARLDPPRDHATLHTPARTVDVWLPGLLEEVLRAAGCPRYKDAVGIARITFRDGGRPRKVELEVGRVPKPCIPVLHAVALTTFAEEGRRIRESVAQIHVLPFGGTFSTCQRQPSIQAGGPPPPLLRPLAAALVSKLSAPSPPIPADVLEKGRPGDAVVDVAVGEKGCVSAVRVLNSSGNEASDVFAIQTVLGWTYSPLVIGGTPHVFRTLDVIGYSWQVKLR